MKKPVIITKLAFGLLFMGAVSSCAFVPLPKASPLFLAASGYGPHDIKTGCLITGDGQQDCSNRDQRVKKYLSTFLPASPQALSEAFTKIGFACNKDQSMWRCSYTESRPPEACVTSIRVSVNALFPVETFSVKENDLIIKAHGVDDPDNNIYQGCFPL